MLTIKWLLSGMIEPSTLKDNEGELSDAVEECSRTNKSSKTAAGISFSPGRAAIGQCFLLEAHRLRDGSPCV